MNDPSKLPWYRHPLVWMLIAIPASAVVAGMFTLYLAVNTDDGLVADDYYKQGMAINRQLARDSAATELALAADIEIDAKSGFIKVLLEPGSLQPVPSQLKLVLNHATQQKQDDHVLLQRGQGMLYVGAFDRDIREGVWYLELSNVPAVADVTGAVRDWRLSRRVRLQGFTRIQMLPLVEG